MQVTVHDYIYIVIAGWYYESAFPEGVYSSKDKALTKAQEIKDKKQYDWVDIEKWEVNGSKIEAVNFYNRR